MLQVKPKTTILYDYVGDWYFASSLVTLSWRSPVLALDLWICPVLSRATVKKKKEYRHRLADDDQRQSCLEIGDFNVI
ncbi:hypothetical protein ACOSP7_030348 [Xanthoceras sorbifolium]